MTKQEGGKQEHGNRRGDHELPDHGPAAAREEKFRQRSQNSGVDHPQKKRQRGRVSRDQPEGAVGVDPLRDQRGDDSCQQVQHGGEPDARVMNGDQAIGIKVRHPLREQGDNDAEQTGDSPYRHPVGEKEKAERALAQKDRGKLGGNG